METENRGLSGTALKWIAMITMTLDHIGAVLVASRTPYIILRLIGRLAFPIYCMLLIEGDAYSRDRRKYVLRLALFALISEIPFNLALSGKMWYPADQNVFFTLCLGEMLLMAMDEIKERCRDYLQSGLITLALAVLCMALAETCKLDYGLGGIALIFLLKVFRPWDWKNILAIAVIMALCWSSSWIQAMAVLAFPLVYGLYNGTRGATGRVMRYVFYAYYPVHLFVLAMMERWMHPL